MPHPFSKPRGYIASAGRQQKFQKPKLHTQHANKKRSPMIQGGLKKTVAKTSARAAVLVAAGSFGFYGYCQSDEGTRRAVTAYRTMIPVVLHYRLMEAKHNYFSTVKQEDWEALDQLYAVPTVSTLGKLQGMYCKYGQTAAGFTNTFGPSWIREFRKLESQVPPRSFQQVLQSIEQETGKPWKETFCTIEQVPLGSASIGQVHRAQLLDGREVAVKVQYPEAQALFQKDIHTIRSFCERFAPEHMVLLEAIEKQNKTELDYSNEAENLREVSTNMIQHGFQPREVVVPKPIADMTTSRMLVMELLPGPKLIDGIQEYLGVWAAQQGTTLQNLATAAKEKIEKEGIPAKYDGPSAAQIHLYRRYLRTRDALFNVAIATYNGTLGWIVRQPITYRDTSLPPNVPRIVDTLMRVHGNQLLRDGVFNSDPHGGNFILMPNGRIGMIDYGAVKRFSRNERLTACLIYAALYRQDQQRLFDLAKVGGYKSKHGKSRVLYKLMQFGYDSWGKEVTGEQNIQQFIDGLKKEDPWEEVPDNFTMVKLMSIRLRALALGMQHPVRCSEWWGPIAEEILKEEGMPYDDWTYEMLVEHRPQMSIQKYKFG